MIMIIECEGLSPHVDVGVTHLTDASVLRLRWTEMKELMWETLKAVFLAMICSKTADKFDILFL